MPWNGTPIGGLAYPEYVTLGGSAQEDDFPRLLALATRRLNRVIQNRATTGYEAEVNAALTEAINLLGEVGEFASESLGSYSYNRRDISDKDIDAAIINALAGTGLTYRGIAWNTAQSPL